MTLINLHKKMNLRAAWDGWTDREITGAYTSDLLSDVMAFARSGCDSPGYASVARLSNAYLRVWPSHSSLV